MKHKLLGEMRPYGWSIVFIFVGYLIAIPVTLIPPLPIKIIVDNVLGTQPMPSYLRIITPILGLSSKESVILIAISILLASTILNYTQNLLNTRYQNKAGNPITMDMPTRPFRQMQRPS